MEVFGAEWVAAAARVVGDAGRDAVWLAVWLEDAEPVVVLGAVLGVGPPHPASAKAAPVTMMAMAGDRCLFPMMTPG